MSFKKLVLLFLGCVFFSACTSSAIKNRKDQQAKVSQTSKLYCEFLSGSIYHDVDVVLNLEMAKRCDSEKHYTITQYKNQSEDNGILYCCTLMGNKSMAKSETRTDSKSETKKPAEKIDEAKTQDEIQ